MHNAGFDPGLTQQFSAPLTRMINHDGTFNVRRRGGNWHDFHPYLQLINMGWAPFFAVIVLGYLVANTIFAAGYYALGTHQLQGVTASTSGGRFLDAFFFSAHTLTTVGYGNIAPSGLGANILSTIESMVGVLGFAVATGLLFGRVSRPSARIGFSRNMVVAPYQEGSALEFRAVNRRRNSLMELEATVMLMTVERDNGEPKRRYQVLRLERRKIVFFPLTWTIVHPIDSQSPLVGLGAPDLERLQAEFLILIKGYDDTFSQTVLARQSYRHDEVLWDRHFAPAFYVDDSGELVLEVSKVGEVA
jgi:inward rectifier potassium channel